MTAQETPNAGGISGDIGTTDNVVPRTNGTGGSELQESGVTISDGDVVDASGFSVGGTQVVGAQQAAIGDPAATTGELQTAVIAILDVLRAHGLIAT